MLNAYSIKRLLITSLMLLSGWSVYAAEDTNIVAAAQADDSAAWESVFVASNQIPFHINLYMKDGLYYEVMETGSYDSMFVTSIFSEKRRLTGRLGTKLSLDGALYHQNGTLPEASSGLAIRKFRVNTYGRAFFLSPLTYGVEFGIADGSFFFNDGYIWFHKVPWVQSVKIGIFTSPMSLESLQSSSFIPMMEKASPVTTFAPGDKLGLQVGGPIPGERATFHTGAFSDAISTENADSAKSAYRFMARGTVLPIFGSDTNSSPRFIHLGGSISYVHSSRDGFRYRSRPESFQAPFLIDTGELLVGDTLIAAVEGATQTGPVLLQSEFFFTNVSDIDGSAGQFWGAYATAGIMLTGETRGYNRNGGHFSGVRPKNKFSFSRRTWGALEWASRFSYTDLTSGSIQGGTMGIISTGINCYLTERNRLMLNGGAAGVRDPSGDSEFYFIQCRFQVEL